jgi:hypothetical protein
MVVVVVGSTGNVVVTGALVLRLGFVVFVLFAWVTGAPW